MELTEDMVSLPLQPGYTGEAIWLDGGKAVAVQVHEPALRINVHLIAAKGSTRMKRRFLVSQGYAGVSGFRHLISILRLPEDDSPWHVFVEDDGGCTVP